MIIIFLIFSNNNLRCIKHKLFKSETFCYIFILVFPKKNVHLLQPWLQILTFGKENWVFITVISTRKARQFLTSMVHAKLMENQPVMKSFDWTVLAQEFPSTKPTVVKIHDKLKAVKNHLLAVWIAHGRFFTATLDGNGPIIVQYLIIWVDFGQT